MSPTAAPLIPDGLDATLVLIRHGESAAIAAGRFQGQADSPLSPTGLRQAALVAARMAGPLDPPMLPVPTGAPLELVHSTLRRAAQTATAIEKAQRAAGSRVPRRPDPRLVEMHQGVWQGMHRTEIAERYGQELATWRRRPLEAWAPGGESVPQLQARVRPALADILASLAEGRPPGSPDRPQVAGYHDTAPDHRWSIAVVHDGVIKIAMLTLFDLPLERFWMWSMDLCGISVVEFRAGTPVLRAHDLTAHLASLQEPPAPADL